MENLKWKHALPTEEGFYWVDEEGVGDERDIHIVSFYQFMDDEKEGEWTSGMMGSDCGGITLSQKVLDEFPDIRIAGPLCPPDEDGE